MQTVAPFVFENVTDEAERVRLVTRSGRRRLAAQMDDFTDHGGLRWGQRTALGSAVEDCVGVRLGFRF